jgi:hypothetical protein
MLFIFSCTIALHKHFFDLHKVSARHMSSLLKSGKPDADSVCVSFQTFTLCKGYDDGAEGSKTVFC